MPHDNKNDLVRAYGFVAIRFATLESRIDERLRQAEPWLSDVQKFVKRMEKRKGKICSLEHILCKWPFGRRTELLRNTFYWAITNRPDFEFNGKDQELMSAEEILNTCLDLAKRRNEVLHSLIISDLKTGEVIRHSRDGPNRVEASDVCQLADVIDEHCAKVIGLQFTLARLGVC